MSQLILDDKDKRHIVLEELKSRPGHMAKESISAFIDRVMGKYEYRQGSDCYFWKAIKNLEEEGKVTKFRYGKSKILTLNKNGKSTINLPFFTNYLAMDRKINNLLSEVV